MGVQLVLLGLESLLGIGQQFGSCLKLGAIHLFVIHHAVGLGESSLESLYSLGRILSHCVAHSIAVSHDNCDVARQSGVIIGVIYQSLYSTYSFAYGSGVAQVNSQTLVHLLLHVLDNFLQLVGSVLQASHIVIL